MHQKEKAIHWIEKILEDLSQKGATIQQKGAVISINSISFAFISSNTSPETITEKCIIVHEDLYHTRKPQLLARIQSRVGLNTERIHGRKTQVHVLSKPDAISFINTNHLMGFGGGKTFLGLYYEDKLVAVTAFSKIRFMKYENPPYHSVELERFCSLRNTTVIGGLDKLIKYYINHYETNDIVTYIDKEWSDGTAYQQLGFECINETDPLHFSIDPTTFKRVLIDSRQIIEKPLYKIVNKGNLKFRKIVASKTL